MHPNKAKSDLKRKINELHDVYTLGLSAMELVKTGYFQKLKEIYEKEIKSFYEIKQLTPFSDLRKDHTKLTSKGAVVIPSNQYFNSMVELEINIKCKQDFLDMIKNDMQAGNEAGLQLEEYKKKYKI